MKILKYSCCNQCTTEAISNDLSSSGVTGAHLHTLMLQPESLNGRRPKGFQSPITQPEAGRFRLHICASFPNQLYVELFDLPLQFQPSGGCWGKGSIRSELTSPPSPAVLLLSCHCNFGWGEKGEGDLATFRASIQKQADWLLSD